MLTLMYVSALLIVTKLRLLTSSNFVNSNADNEPTNIALCEFACLQYNNTTLHVYVHSLRHYLGTSDINPVKADC